MSQETRLPADRRNTRESGIRHSVDSDKAVMRNKANYGPEALGLRSAQYGPNLRNKANFRESRLKLRSRFAKQSQFSGPLPAAQGSPCETKPIYDGWRRQAEPWELAAATRTVVGGAVKQSQSGGGAACETKPIRRRRGLRNKANPAAGRAEQSQFRGQSPGRLGVGV